MLRKDKVDEGQIWHLYLAVETFLRTLLSLSLDCGNKYKKKRVTQRVERLGFTFEICTHEGEMSMVF
jgi:hypothetical protein